MENSEIQNVVTRSIATLSRELDRQYASPHELCIEIGGWAILLRSNSARLLELLRDYYGDLAPSTGSGQAPSTGSGQAPSTGSGQAPSTGSGQAPSTGSGRAFDLEIRLLEAPAQDFGFAYRKLK